MKVVDFVIFDGFFNILFVDCYEKYVGINVNFCINVEEVKG